MSSLGDKDREIKAKGARAPRPATSYRHAEQALQEHLRELQEQTRKATQSPDNDGVVSVSSLGSSSLGDEDREIQAKGACAETGHVIHGRRHRTGSGRPHAGARPAEARVRPPRLVPAAVPKADANGYQPAQQAGHGQCRKMCHLGERSRDARAAAMEDEKA